MWMVNTVDSGERALEYIKASTKISAPEIIIVDQVGKKLFFEMKIIEINYNKMIQLIRIIVFFYDVMYNYSNKYYDRGVTIIVVMIVVINMMI